MNVIEIIFCAEVFVFEMLHTNAGYYALSGLNLE